MSKSVNARIQIGISGLGLEDYQSNESLPSISELDIPSFLSWDQRERRALRERITLGHQVIGSFSSAWIYAHDELERDKLPLLREAAAELSIQTWMIRAQTRHLLHSFDLGFPAQIDYPESARIFQTSGPPSVWDPMWDTPSPTSRLGQIAKIHGWHPARWVRRYSTGQIQACVKQVSQFVSENKSDIFLILGHSQRREQWPEFQMAFDHPTRTLK